MNRTRTERAQFVGAREKQLEFCILGSLQVVDAGRPVPLGGKLPRALLAALLVHMASFDRQTS